MNSAILSKMNEGRSKRRSYGEASIQVVNRLKEISKLNECDPLIKECYEVAAGQHDYIDNCVFPETPLQRKIVADSQSDKITAKGFCMISSPLQGNFLKQLAEMTHAKDILEIGMYTGYGTVSLAESGHCESVVTLDVEPYYETFLKTRLAGTLLEKKVRVIIGPAQDSLATLKNEDKKFDLVFIDANKEGYLNYYKYIMDNDLLRQTGTIACDNVLWYGATYDQTGTVGKALHEFVEYVKNDERVNQILLPISDGIFVITPKFKS